MSSAISISKEIALSLYRRMQVIRQTEEQLARSHQRGLVHGACHTYVGEEAIASAVCEHLRPDDVVFSTHRGHGHALAKGLEPRELIAELYGREGGCSMGRGGSMHIFKPEIGMMGTSGIVGPCILQACGGGYSFKIKGTDNVSVAFFGDGAVNNGAFHEGLNMASIWNLPSIFVCENNQFATEVPFEYASAIPDVWRRAQNYGIPGFEVDGNDVLEIYQIAQEAVKRARDGEGPTLIECKTYRTRAHAEGMGDFTYRTREDVEEWKEKCPIKRFRQVVTEDDFVVEDELNEIDREVTELVTQAQKWAEASPYPDGTTAATHVYCERPSPPSSPIQNFAPEVSGSERREITYIAATLEALSEEMACNDNIFVMGEGSGKRGGNFNTTTGLFDIYGTDRLCDTPICERGFVGLAGGAAMTGTRPVIDFMFADFIMDAVGETINQIAKMQYMSSGRIKMPVLLRGCVGIGHSAATHHSGNYYHMYGHFPGLRVVVPSNAYDAKGLMKRALNCDDPVIFLEHRELLTTKTHVPAEEYEIEFGVSRIVRTGNDVTVVAIAKMVDETEKAAEELEKQGISIEIIDPRTVSPLDTDAVAESVAKTGRLLVVDEAFDQYGFSSEIAARVSDVAFDELDAPIKRLCGVFTPTPYSPTLEEAIIPNVSSIVNAVLELTKE
ncbi:TPA: dehydrogenase [Candidatus Poribacteria bacterium]|nr:dehydrogenase [Candidatus Poribacteria bacterium]HIB91042.1 dehydrogenase [Candidatus Poribacteria bacterium]HIC02412.1 dehydrogenase [Candidatus Poribacteria bacterium]HIO46859.1 dehydrogenase [Candidatus Poribacteria bacterium]